MYGIVCFRYPGEAAIQIPGLGDMPIKQESGGDDMEVDDEDPFATSKLFHYFHVTLLSQPRSTGGSFPRCRSTPDREYTVRGRSLL